MENFDKSDSHHKLQILGHRIQVQIDIHLMFMDNIKGQNLMNLSAMA